MRYSSIIGGYEYNQPIRTVNDIRNMDENNRMLLFRAMSIDKELFARIVMQHIVKDVPKYQSEMYQLLSERTKYLCVVSFRGSAKSTIGHTIDTTHDICFRHEPFTLFISESVDQSTADLVNVQTEIEQNEFIHAIFGNLVGPEWNKGSLEAKNGCYVMSRGYKSKLRGIKFKNTRPTKVKLDDIESEDNTETERQRRLLQKWIYKQVFRVGMPNKTQFQFFGTIVHKDGFLAKAKNNPYFTGRDGKYVEIPVEKNGVPAWESVYPMQWVVEEKEKYRRNNMLAEFLQEMYHIPAIDGSDGFDTDKVIRLDAVFGTQYGVTYLQTPTQKIPINVYVGIDPADSETERADFTNITVVGILPSTNSNLQKKVVILHSEQVKLSPSKMVVKASSICSRYVPRMVTFEVQGGREAYYELLRQQMMRDGSVFPMRRFKTNQSKSNKWLKELEPYINNSCVSVLSNCDGWETVKAEMESFNNEVKEHDDSIDALFLSIQNAHAPYPYDVDAKIKELELEALAMDTKKVANSNWFTM